MAVFHPDINLDYSSLKWLEEAVRQAHASKSIYMSVQGFAEAASIKLCGVFIGDNLASFAWYMLRNSCIENDSYLGLSIGLVTTLPEYRRQGLASLLLKCLEDHARSLNCDYLYLAGIPNFYHRLGFTGFAPKSKFLFPTSKLPLAGGRIIEAAPNHLSFIASLYDKCRDASNGLSTRSSDLWSDLLGPLSSTFLFFRPRLILNKDDDVIAYFCTSPGDPSLIREFIPSLEPGSVETALGVIAKVPDFSAAATIEVFAPFRGPVLLEAYRNLEADFCCFLRPRSSNMVKWLSGSALCYANPSIFIYQGDNL